MQVSVDQFRCLQVLAVFENFCKFCFSVQVLVVSAGFFGFWQVSAINIILSVFEISMASYN